MLHCNVIDKALISIKNSFSNGVWVLQADVFAPKTRFRQRRKACPGGGAGA
jgi:hypothetical protein